jgi:hypothetical protein
VSPPDASERPDVIDAPDVIAPDDGPSSSDAVTPGDAEADADAAPDAAREGSLPCDDACMTGDMQCTPNSGGPFSGTATCVMGSRGCTVWGSPVMCAMSFGCCVGCTATPCEDGSPYQCSDCPVGPVGAPCTQDTDCASNACDAVTLKCVANQCKDHRQDGMETDVDCGGAICDGCPDGMRCVSSLDCEIGTCSEHVCL